MANETAVLRELLSLLCYPWPLQETHAKRLIAMLDAAPAPEPQPKRKMVLPNAKSHGMTPEDTLHYEDDWCPKARCLVYCDQSVEMPAVRPKPAADAPVREPDAPRALTDADRWNWFFGPTSKSHSLDDYLRGIREGWDSDKWREWADAAILGGKEG